MTFHTKVKYKYRNFHIKIMQFRKFIIHIQHDQNLIFFVVVSVSQNVFISSYEQSTHRLRRKCYADNKNVCESVYVYVCICLSRQFYVELRRRRLFIPFHCHCLRFISISWNWDLSHTLTPHMYNCLR